MKRVLVLTLLTLTGCTSSPPVPSPVAPASPEAMLAPLVPYPNAQGRLISTGEATDLAIQGDAFFVLSQREAPTSIDELIFTRDGAFQFEFEEGPQPPVGVHKLVNREGYFVMAYQASVGPGRPFGTAPEEAIDSFSTVVADERQPQGMPLRPAALRLEQIPSQGNLRDLAFTPQGMVQLAGSPPRDAANNEANIHVVLATFAFAQYLKRVDRDTYTYRPAAGRIRMGTAADGRPGRQLGMENTVVSGALERR